MANTNYRNNSSFRTYPQLTSQSLIRQSENLVLVLGKPFTDLFMCGMFPSNRRVVLYHSRAVTILTRQIYKRRQPLWRLNPSNIAAAPYKSIVTIAKQVILQPYTEMRVSTATPVSGLSSFKAMQFNQQSFHLHVPRGVINKSMDRKFGFLISNFSSTIQLLQNKWIWHILSQYPQYSSTYLTKKARKPLQEDADSDFQTSTVASIYYKLAENRETEMTRNKILNGKSFFQHLANA